MLRGRGAVPHLGAGGAASGAALRRGGRSDVQRDPQSQWRRGRRGGGGGEGRRRGWPSRGTGGSAWLPTVGGSSAAPSTQRTAQRAREEKGDDGDEGRGCSACTDRREEDGSGAEERTSERLTCRRNAEGAEMEWEWGAGAGVERWEGVGEVESSGGGQRCSDAGMCSASPAGGAQRGAPSSGSHGDAAGQRVTGSSARAPAACHPVPHPLPWPLRFPALGTRGGRGG